MSDTSLLRTSYMSSCTVNDQEFYEMNTIYAAKDDDLMEFTHTARVIKITCYERPQIIQVRPSRQYYEEDWMFLEHLKTDNISMAVHQSVLNPPESPISSDSDFSLILLDALESCPHIITNGNTIKQKRLRRS
jgi:hypothetical protein